MKRINFLISGILVVLFTSCSIQKDFGSLTKVDGFKVDTSLFKNDYIEANFKVEKDRIKFNLTNVFEGPIDLVWDKSTFNLGGNVQGVVHLGTRMIDKDKPQKPTHIPSKGTISDVAIPTNRIKYVPGTSTGWYIFPLMENVSTVDLNLAFNVKDSVKYINLTFER